MFRLSVMTNRAVRSHRGAGLGTGRAGRTRVETELAWQYEATKLLHAYDVLFGSAG